MSYTSVLFNKNFTFYLIGIAFSNMGSAFTTFVFPLMILKLTGSAFQVGIVSALSFIPYAILGLPAGALIDRLNKKTIMKCADIIRFVSYLSIPVLSFFNMLSIFQIYVVAIISGIGLVFHSISEVSIIPSIVKEEDLASANSYIYATQNVSEFLGPIIGGLLYTYMGYSILIFIDSMTFLLSFFSLILIKIETKSIFNQEKLSGKNFLSDVKVGFDYLLSNSTIRVMAVVVSLSNLIISPYYIYIVMFVKEDMNQSSQALGLVLGISSLGALIGSLSASFLLMKLMPGSPFNDAKLNAEQKEILNEKYGLNDPVATQYLHYLKNVVTGDFGNSFQYHNQPVWDLIKPRLLPSFEMGLTAMFIGVILGLILGVAAATKQNSWVDYTTTVISVIAVSVPSFVLAVLLQYVFAVKLRWFPVAGWEGFSTAVLPSLALSAAVLATVARYIRAEMIEVLSSDYILLARAKGNSTMRVLFGHALRNALIPIITIIVPMLASILTGTLTIENIFGVPGLGDQFVRSITTNDFSVIMAITLLFSTLFIVSIFIVDILYGVIDPRIRVQGGKK